MVCADEERCITLEGENCSATNAEQYKSALSNIPEKTYIEPEAVWWHLPYQRCFAHGTHNRRLALAQLSEGSAPKMVQCHSLPILLHWASTLPAGKGCQLHCTPTEHQNSPGLSLKELRPLQEHLEKDTNQNACVACKDTSKKHFQRQTPKLLHVEFIFRFELFHLDPANTLRATSKEVPEHILCIFCTDIAQDKQCAVRSCMKNFYCYPYR